MIRRLKISDFEWVIVIIGLGSSFHCTNHEEKIRWG